MTTFTYRLLKKYAALAGILVLFFTLFFGLAYLRKKVEATYLTLAARNLCSAYEKKGEQSIRILGPDMERREALPSRAVLAALFEGRKASAFMLPVTGKYGVYTALFLYERSIGCKFCGLAGINILPEQAAYYGITPATIEIQQYKIGRLMKKQVTHET